MSTTVAILFVIIALKPVVKTKYVLTLSSLTLPLSSHQLQAANCFRNSRLVVDEDDLKWVKKIRKLPCIGTSFMGIFLLKPLSFSKIKDVFRDVKWCFNASWGLKGLNMLKYQNTNTDAIWDLNFTKSSHFQSLEVVCRGSETQTSSDWKFTPCPAEMFPSIVHSSESGIANAISSFKWQKYIYINEKKTSRIPWLLHYWINKYVTKTVYQILWYFYWSKTCLKPNIYIRLVPAAQGLKCIAQSSRG